ncbi:MAG: hypothetical protein Q8P10_03275 [bacterium]|nr:hypothetical protein [bacterium]
MDDSLTSGIVLGQEQKLDIEPRYFLQTAERAMKNDVIRGLVELITNADDSYGEIEFNHQQVSGEISIFIERKRQSKNTTIMIADRAEGMELGEMVSKLRRVGGITSNFIKSKGAKTRGLMGRGSKECVVFGNLTFKSIKDDEYSELQIKKPAHFIAVAKRSATELDRIELNIPRRNGTVVILEVDSRFKIPNHQFLVENLPKYYSLRDISISPQRKLELFDLGHVKGRKDRLAYVPKAGKIELDETFIIPGYPKAEAHIRILKTPERIKVETNSPYWEGGILVKSNYAIHGVTGLSRDIENNPYFEHYFGEIRCPYIDELAIEYELQEKEKITHPSDNPSRIIDPLRSEGLTGDHPFTNALYAEAIRRIKILLKRDEEAATSQIMEIENKKTTERLKKLANAVSKFIKERTEDFEDPDDENDLSYSDIPSGGMIAIPGGLKIPLGEERKFYVYVRPASQDYPKHILATTDSKTIQLSTNSQGLIDRNDGIFYAPFSVKGVEYGNAAKVKIVWGNTEQYLLASVIEKVHDHPYVEGFSFEKTEYRIRQGKQKEIKILAKWPDFVHGPATCSIIADNDEFIDIIGQKVRLRYTRFDDGTEIAIGKVKLFGRKIGGPTIIKTIFQHKEISTRLIVLPSKELGHNIEIKVVDEDLGEQRAVWDGDLLKIGGRHSSVRRYLGPAPDFSNQDSIHFRLLLAELIADNVARRVLELNAQKNIGEYEDMDVSSFYNRHRKYMNDFLEIAHEIQIPESEIKN